MSSSVDGRAVRGEATRLRILDAARDLLVERGYSGTSTRAVAERAETQLSLVHYHFGGKQQLLAAVLDRQDEQLLDRQRQLYAGPGPLSEKWRTACRFLDDDIESGYVRALWELWTAGLADPELAGRWRATMAGWRHLIESVFTDWAAEQEVELPLSPRVIASLVANIFQGIEIELLAGVSEQDSPHREALEQLGAMIERAEMKRTETLGTEFARALAAKDRDRLLQLMHPEIDFRGLTPSRSWEASDRDAVMAVLLRNWFEDKDEIQALERVESDTVGDRQRVGYRFSLTNPEGRFVVEQQAYLEPRDGQIGWMRVVCSGFRPA